MARFRWLGADLQACMGDMRVALRVHGKGVAAGGAGRHHQTPAQAQPVPALRLCLEFSSAARLANTVAASATHLSKTDLRFYEPGTVGISTLPRMRLCFPGEDRRAEKRGLRLAHAAFGGAPFCAAARESAFQEGWSHCPGVNNVAPRFS